MSKMLCMNSIKKQNNQIESNVRHVTFSHWTLFLSGLNNFTCEFLDHLKTDYRCRGILGSRLSGLGRWPLNWFSIWAFIRFYWQMVNRNFVSYNKIDFSLPWSNEFQAHLIVSRAFTWECPWAILGFRGIFGILSTNRNANIFLCHWYPNLAQ